MYVYMSAKTSLITKVVDVDAEISAHKHAQALTFANFHNNSNNNNKCYFHTFSTISTLTTTFLRLCRWFTVISFI